MDNGLEEIFLQRKYTNDQLLMKRHLTSVVIRELQTQTTMRYHFAPNRMAK